MKNNFGLTPSCNKLMLLLITVVSLLIGNNTSANAQGNISIQAMHLDGMDISKDNILQFQVLSNLNYSLNATVHGTLHYRNSEHRIDYQFNMKLNPGLNTIEQDHVSVTWNYSSSAMRELFTQHNTLPCGMYEYCILVSPQNVAGEVDLGLKTEECMYNKKQELFLLNLIQPENNAKLYEKNPALNWVANYSFSNDLTYRLRVAEIKEGQNTENAIARNNPIYQESGLRQNMMLYPVTARPLEYYQPYAWSVDAYYKGILLGSAEPWRFVIIEDSLNEVVPKDMSYVEVNIENGTNTLLVAGKIKFKYIETELRKNRIQILISGLDGKVIKSIKSPWDVKLGENRIEFDLASDYPLKHKTYYYFILTDSLGKIYKVKIKYFNPEFLN